MRQCEHTLIKIINILELNGVFHGIGESMNIFRIKCELEQITFEAWKRGQLSEVDKRDIGHLMSCI